MFYVWIGSLTTALLPVFCTKKPKLKTTAATISKCKGREATLSTATKSIAGKTMGKSKKSDTSLVVQNTQCEQMTGQQDQRQPMGSQADKVDESPGSLGGEKYLDNLFGDIHTQEGDDLKRNSKKKSGSKSPENKDGTLGNI